MARVVSQQQDQYRGVFRWYMAQAWAQITQQRLLQLTLSMTMYIVVDFEVMSNVCERMKAKEDILPLKDVQNSITTQMRASS